MACGSSPVFALLAFFFFFSFFFFLVFFAHVTATSQRKLSAKSERVKAVDVHPKEPWVLSALYDGKIFIWNYMNRQLVKSFEASTLPVRCGAFIARKSWVVAGCDDMHLRVYNYNTLDKVTAFEAHQDYIRAVAVHPSQPFVLSSSDDMLIKLW